MTDELPDRLNMDKASSAFKNLAGKTTYKELQKVLAERGSSVFRGSIKRDAQQKSEREARERAQEIARLRAEEEECGRLASESDKAGNFKRFARFWNRMDAARQGLIRLGAAGPGA